MASQTEIVNLGLTLLGDARILNIDQDVKPAREAKAIWSIALDAILARYNWNFAKERASLPALVDVPISQYLFQYQLPSDCLRVMFVGETYVGIDLTDYRGSPTQEFSLEGRKILTDFGAPLLIRYIKRVTDTTQFDPVFVLAFSCELAMWLAEPLTQSATKRESAENTQRKYVSEAVRVNAIALPPEHLPDDEWLISRL